MARFKVLDIRAVLVQRIGIIPTSIITPPHKFFRIFQDFYVWIILFLFLVSSIIYVMWNFSDLDNVLKTVPMIIGGTQSLGMIMGVGFRWPHIVTLREKLQAIVDKADEKSEVHKIYWKWEQSCRSFTQTLSRYVHAEQAIYAPVFLRSLYLVANGNFDASQLILPYNLVLPWDPDTIPGWYLYYFFSASIAFSFSSAMIPVTTFFVSCSKYIHALCEHYAYLGETIDSDVQSRMNERNPIRRRVFDIKIQKTYADLVELNVQIFVIFNLVASIFSGSIFALLPPMAIFLAMEMYTMENFRNSMDAVSIGFSIICVFVGTLWSSLFSVYSDRAIDQIEDIGVNAYNVNWVDMPPTLQKYSILIIARSQEEVYFTGLGLIYCNLETFGKLVNSSISYYLVFRELSNQ